MDFSITELKTDFCLTYGGGQFTTDLLSSFRWALFIGFLYMQRGVYDIEVSE